MKIALKPTARLKQMQILLFWDNKNEKVPLQFLLRGIREQKLKTAYKLCTPQTERFQPKHVGKFIQNLNFADPGGLYL